MRLSLPVDPSHDPALLTSLSPFLALATLVALSGCDDKSTTHGSSAKQYGDPIGIEIAAHGTVPGLSVAVAVTKGRDPTPFVGPLASAVFGAAQGCPDFIKAMGEGKTARVELGARNGALEALGSVPDQVGACLRAALGGKPVTMDRPDALDVILELRAAVTDAAHKP